MVVLGTSIIAEHLFTEVMQSPHRGYKPFRHVRSIPELESLLRDHKFSVLVIDNNIELPDTLIEKIFAKKITTLSLVKTYEEILQKIPLERINETEFIQDIQNDRVVTLFFTRIFEYCISVLFLIISFPFWIITAIAIKLEDGGPIFYVQPRIGLLGNQFMLYKFRSMSVTAADKFGDWAVKNDPRITRVGRVIRKLHIDEIPQMINVLKGDITLVGPRPDMVSMQEEFHKRIPHYHLRHIIKPGFTGWAQIKYRAAASEDDFVERFQYDLYYIKHREFFFDLGIIMRTLQIIFSHTL